MCALTDTEARVFSKANIVRADELVCTVSFVCRDGVDATKLLNIVRRELLTRAEARSGNALVDERCVTWAA